MVLPAAFLAGGGFRQRSWGLYSKNQGTANGLGPCGIESWGTRPDPPVPNLDLAFRGLLLGALDALEQEAGGDGVQILRRDMTGTSFLSRIADSLP